MKILFLFVSAFVVIWKITECQPVGVSYNKNDRQQTAVDYRREDDGGNLVFRLLRHVVFRKANALLKIKSKIKTHIRNAIESKLDSFLGHYTSRATTPIPSKPTATQKPPIGPTSPGSFTTITSTEGFQRSSTTKVPSTTITPIANAMPCKRNSNLVILLDSSYRVGYKYFQTALEFALRLTLAWRVNRANGISLYTFSSDTKTIFTLNQSHHLDNEQFRERILGAPYIGGLAATDLALQRALVELQEGDTSLYVLKNVIVLTNGMSTNMVETKRMAKTLHRVGVRVAAVGLGAEIGETELLDIKGNNTKGWVFTTPYKNLLELLKPVSLVIRD